MNGVRLFSLRVHPLYGDVCGGPDELESDSQVILQQNIERFLLA